MTKRFKTWIVICLVFLMSISGVRIDNTEASYFYSIAPASYTNTSVMVDSEVYHLNRGYSCIEQQDYWSNNHSTPLSFSLFKRSQGNFRSYERNETTITIVDIVSKVVLFSSVMLLCATGGAGLSMPFRCLLSYIHGMDGKKRIA